MGAGILGVLQTSAARSDTLACSCSGTGQHYSKGDILKLRSSFCVSAGISGLDLASEISKK
jgi:hypothetical protein